MTLKVYWACLEKEWMVAEEPELVAKRFYKNKTNKNKSDLAAIQYCPSFNDNLKNLFCLKSIYDYEFYLNEDGVYSNNCNQEFFNDHVLIRSLEEKFFSFKNSYIFFTESPSLLTTFYEFPFLEDNNITKKCMPVSGQFDIAKWFRNSEFAFYLKSQENSFKIEKGEVYSYIRFHTKEKIFFEQFRYTEKLAQYQNDGFSLNNLAINLNKMQEYYKNFKNKKAILKEIKENII